MFGMSRKVVTEVNAIVEQALGVRTEIATVNPKEGVALAEAKYQRVWRALGELRVAVFTGTVDAHAVRRQKADLEDELERAGKALQAAMAEDANLQP